MRPRPTTATIVVLCNRMLHSLSNLHPHKPRIKQVCSLSSLFSTKHSFFSTSLEGPPPPPPPSSSTDKINKTHTDLSLIANSGIAKSVILRCSHLWEKKGETFAHTSLKDLLLKISDISPEITRRFMRVSELKPEYVLEILLGFQFECENPAIEARKVESLWGIFKWSSNQSKGFMHLPQSYEVMASMLVQVGMLREVEFLLSSMETRGILLDSHEILGNLIERYARDRELERAILMFDRMRGQGLVPSLSCYRVLLKLLVSMNKTQLALRVYVDMMEMGFQLSDVEKSTFENVVRLLCGDGKIQEARNLVKKVLALGLEPSNLVFNEIASGYCEKKDFEDLMNFFVEMNRAPDVLAGNKIIFSLCSNFGTERADLFMKELEHLGFSPDEITFGILIGWSCREGKLKNAFIYLSDILLRCLKPDVRSYNALISEMFKEDMWNHVRDILYEMIDKGITPNMSTFRVLLAGYCKARQFDEVKVTVGEMVNHGLIQLSSLEDRLSKAFMVLGLNPLNVRVKRDNDVGLSKTEFCDNLGNGLYLETDLDEYEKTVTGVLEDSMIPDFNLLVMKEVGNGNFEIALVMIDEMVRWGQEPSLSAFSALVNELCASRCRIKAIIGLLEKFPKLANQLDLETLNLLVQSHSRKGFTYKGSIILDGMLQRHLMIKNETYTALITGLCKKGNLKGLLGCWDLARKDNWLPELKDCKTLVGCLCQQAMLKEALELLESMLATYPHLRLDICDVFLEKLCVTGFTRIAHVLVEELLQQGCILDQMAYSHLLRGFCKERRFSEAFTIFDIMLAKNLAPCLDVSVLLISQLCRAGRFEKAIALKEIGLREQSLISLTFYSALMHGFCKTGKVGEAANLFQDMLSKGLLLDTEIYNMLVQGHCRANNLKKAGELLGVMLRKNLSLSISSYRNLVRLMCMEGRVFQASSAKELMLRESNPPYLIIYNILFFYLFLTGNSLLVNSLLDELQENGLLLDEVTYNFLVYGFSQSKYVSSSVQYLTTMISKEFRPSSRSLRAVISCLCDEGELGKALEMSREMELRGWTHGSIVQNAIVEGLLSHGKLQEAENFLDRMVEKGLFPDNINYDNLIKRFCWYGRLKKAVDLLNIMVKKGNAPNSTSYDFVIHGFCARNKLDQAMDFHAEMLDRNLKPNINTWDVLVRNLCCDGRTVEAERLLISMVRIGETPTREMYCSVINRYRFENNLSKASELLQALQQNGYAPDFETHWSLISNLRNSNEKDNGNSSRGFLSRLLSDSGFVQKKDSKAKLG